MIRLTAITHSKMEIERIKSSLAVVPAPPPAMQSLTSLFFLLQCSEVYFLTSVVAPKLGICHYVVLYFQIIEQLEIGI
jgi:hypothetical protein